MGIAVALSSSSFILLGRHVHIRRGEAWDADSEIVAANPGMFSTDPAHALGHDFLRDAPVQSATARPGEKSTARRVGRRKAADTPPADPPVTPPPAGGEQSGTDGA